MRDGKLDDALADLPERRMPSNQAGTLLDLMGKGAEARKYFQKAIDAAPDAGGEGQCPARRWRCRTPSRAIAATP